MMAAKGMHSGYGMSYGEAKARRAPMAYYMTVENPRETRRIRELPHGVFGGGKPDTVTKAMAPIHGQVADQLITSVEMPGIESRLSHNPALTIDRISM